MGKPLGQARGEVDTAIKRAQALVSMAGQVLKEDGQRGEKPTEGERDDGHRCVARRSLDLIRITLCVCLPPQ